MESVKSTAPLQPCRHHGEQARDGVAIVAPVFELSRFTREEAERADAAGWRLHAGWFERASGLEWAWFRREVGDGETRHVP